MVGVKINSQIQAQDKPVIGRTHVCVSVLLHLD